MKEIVKIEEYKNIVILSNNKNVFSGACKKLILISYEDGSKSFIDVDGYGDITNNKDFSAVIKDNSKKKIIFEK